MQLRLHGLLQSGDGGATWQAPGTHLRALYGRAGGAVTAGLSRERFSLGHVFGLEKVIEHAIQTLLKWPLHFAGELEKASRS